MTLKEGASKPDYSKFTPGEYIKKISTPSQRDDYVNNFIIRDILDGELQEDPTRNVNIFSIACGHAHEFEHFAKLPQDKAKRVHLTGLDISGDNLGVARSYYKTEHPDLNERINFIRGDVTEQIPELEEGTFDIAMGINAMAYVPANMLNTIYKALKPGGKAVVNFMVTDKNPEYIEYYRSKGMVKGEQMYQAQKNLSTFSAPMMQHDHSGNESEEMAKLGRQSFFYETEQVKGLLKFVGFEICEHAEYEFPSMASSKNIHDVFTVRKPLAAGKQEEQKKVYEQIIQQMFLPGVDIGQISTGIIDKIRERVGDHQDEIKKRDFSDVSKMLPFQNEKPDSQDRELPGNPDSETREK